MCPVGETAGVVIGAAWPLTTPQGPSEEEERLDSLADVLKALGVQVETVAVVGLLVDRIC